MANVTSAPAELLAAVLESMADAVAVVDPGGRVVAVNQHWRALARAGIAPAGELCGEGMAWCGREVVGERLRAVVVGERGFFAGDVVVDRPTARRWFELRATSVAGAGAIVSLRESTARRRAEHALRVSESRGELLVRAAEVGLWDWDLRTDEVYYSAEWKRQLGYAEDELRGTFSEWETRVHPEDLDAVRATIDEWLAGAPPVDVEYRMRHRDGAWRWFLSRVDLTRDDAGAPLRMMGCNLDVTARKEVESSLRESEDRFRGAFEHSAIGMALISRDGAWLKVNQRVTAILGYSEDELADMTFQELTHPDDLDKDLSQIAKVIAGELDAYSMTKRYIHRDGSVVWALLAVAYVRAPSRGAPYFVSQISDISEQVAAEAAQRHVKALLRDSAAHRQAILDNMDDGVVTIEEDGRIASFNRAAARIFAYEADEVIGRNVAMLLPEPHRSRHDGYLRAYAEGGVARMIGCPRELEGRRKDGGVFPINLAISEITRGGRPIFIGVVRDITDQRRREEEIHRLAFFDPLTGLPNRRLLLDRIGRAVVTASRSGTRGAVMFIDIDHFKVLNDTRGHEVGDLMLREVASRLAACVAEADTVGRLGGDEFVVLVEGLSADEREAATHAGALANDLLAALRRPYALRGRVHTMTPSIGISLFGPEHEGVEELLKKADMAMYDTKARGRDGVRFFDPVMQSALEARGALEAALRRGLAERQFEVHYQVQVDRDGAPTGFEALVRWSSPERGLVGPAEFIPVAEETGLIIPLGCLVLEAACEQLAAWADDPQARAWTIAVNVSAAELGRADLVANLRSALAKTGADPRRLKLELTESVLIGDIEATVRALRAVKELGVGLALDDFGTGYSSLAYLQRLPLDQLKIDRSFVRDVATSASDGVIARTIVALGKSLGLHVLAEGVETAEQRDSLASLGCDAFQGYFYGRPAPASVAVEIAKSLSFG